MGSQLLEERIEAIGKSTLIAPELVGAIDEQQVEGWRHLGWVARDCDRAPTITRDARSVTRSPARLEEKATEQGC